MMDGTTYPPQLTSTMHQNGGIPKVGEDEKAIGAAGLGYGHRHGTTDIP
jgi:hypothetical protein